MSARGAISRLRSAAASERGLAVPLVLSVIVIVIGFGAVMVAVATHNVDRSERDRLSSRALQAADAGLDAAAYRMNKMILATKTDNLLTDPATLEALLGEAGCIEVGAGAFLQATLVSSGICQPTQGEMVDSEVDGDGLGVPAEFRYYVKLRANVLVSGRSLLERQIVSIGEVDGVMRRVSGLYRFDVEAPANSVVSRIFYTECTAREPGAGEDPSADCPTV